MNTLQFPNGIDPGVVAVVSPISGQRVRVHRARMTGSPRRIAFFPREGGQLIKVPQFGYTLEAMAFGVCGIASFALILMLLLKVR